MLFPLALTRLAATAVGLAALAPAVWAQAPQTVRDLTGTPLTTTEAGRKELKHLVSCALPASVQVRFQADGNEHRLDGGLGLAPEWLDRGMTVPEQRWVSACILARTNAVGATVQLSMRSPAPTATSKRAYASRAPHPPSSPPGLQADAAEQKQFDRLEGTFFGNLFAEKPVGYVCGPTLDVKAQARALAERIQWLRSHQRLCSLVAGADGSAAVTACGFVHVGPCQGNNWVQQGVDYRETSISVYLPGGPGQAGFEKQ
ncbi:MAG: hypothetical protein KA181_07210 [Xylophilus sp.]|nr:hypothetical protein [Xylophilus sp.]